MPLRAAARSRRRKLFMGSHGTSLRARELNRIGHAPETFNAHARAIFDPRQRMRIDGENRSRPCQQGNMEANGSEVAKVRADRSQCDFNSAPGQRVKLASKTGALVGTPLRRSG